MLPCMWIFCRWFKIRIHYPFKVLSRSYPGRVLMHAKSKTKSKHKPPSHPPKKNRIYFRDITNNKRKTRVRGQLLQSESLCPWKMLFFETNFRLPYDVKKLLDRTLSCFCLTLCVLPPQGKRLSCGKSLICHYHDYMYSFWKYITSFMSIPIFVKRRRLQKLTFSKTNQKSTLIIMFAYWQIDVGNHWFVITCTNF